MPRRVFDNLNSLSIRYCWPAKSRTPLLNSRTETIPNTKTEEPFLYFYIYTFTSYILPSFPFIPFLQSKAFQEKQSNLASIRTRIRHCRTHPLPMHWFSLSLVLGLALFVVVVSERGSLNHQSRHRYGFLLSFISVSDCFRFLGLYNFFQSLKLFCWVCKGMIFFSVLVFWCIESYSAAFDFCGFFFQC